MPHRSPSQVLPRDPSTLPPQLAAPELGTSLAKTWKSWHASDPPLGDGDPRELDTQVRDLAQRELEALWDEIDRAGSTTGKIITYEIFPSLLDSDSRRRLIPLE